MFVGIDRNRHKRHRPRQVQLVTILLLMVLLTFGCGKNYQKPQEPAAEASTGPIPAIPGSTTITISRPMPTTA